MVLATGEGVGVGVGIGVGVGCGLGVGVGEGPGAVEALTPPHPAITSAAAAAAREKASFLRLKKAMVAMILDVKRQVAVKTIGMGRWASSANERDGGTSCFLRFVLRATMSRGPERSAV